MPLGQALEFLRRNGAGYLALRVFDRAWATSGSYFARAFLLAKPQSTKGLPRGMQSRWLSADEVAAAQRLGIEISESSVAEAESGYSRCLALLDGDHLAAYAWFTTQDVPPSHCLGAAIELPPGMAYHYKGFTRPEYRGLSLYPALLAEGAELLAHEGISQVLLAVERSNRASLRSCRRAGCHELGNLRVWGANGSWGISAPAGAERVGVRFTAGAQWKGRQPSLCKLT